MSPRKLITTILLLFIVTRIILTAIGVSSLIIIENTYHTRTGVREQSIETAPLVLKTWAVWDSTHYLKIVKQGYPKSFNPRQFNNYGFFPGYPLVIWIVSTVFFFGNALVAGIVISNICFIIALYFLYRIVEREYNQIIAERTLYIFSLLPFSFIFSGLMSESLFLLLIVLTIYFVQQNKLLPATILAFLATITRPVGIVLIIFLAVRLMRNKEPFFTKIKKIFLTSLGPALGLLSVGTFFYIRSGDFFAYTHTQAGAWNHYFSNPFTEIYKNLISDNIHLVISAVFILLSSAILIYGIRKLRLEYTIFAFGLLFFHLFTGSILASPRYSVVVFPIAIASAYLLRSENSFHFSLIGLGMIQAVCMASWSLGLLFTI
jgi:Gpi18-like mannosyltransferase